MRYDTGKITNIVVVGGGNTGWSVASILVDRIPSYSPIKIHLIESKDIPVIGVGESTTGQVRRFINMVGHLGGEEEFLRETGSTYKYGIYHSDWKEVGKSFVSPIGGDFLNWTRFPHQYYDYMRIYHVAKGLRSYESVYQSQCMLRNKVFYMDVPKDNPYQNILGSGGEKVLLNSDDIGFHLDSYKTGDFLREKTLATGRVKRIESTVKSVKRDESGYVTGLVLEDDLEIEADLYFDCTGFSRLLKLESNKFIEYKNSLLLNSTIVFPEEYVEGEEIKTYTHAKAMNNGWMFEIPLQHRVGRGYNFSSDFTDPESAKKEVEDSLGREIEVKRTFKYSTGRVEKFWDANVISIGLASGFMEPLEATTLHAALKQIEHFMENYFSDVVDVRNESIKNQYNRDMSFFYDDLKDFIIFHYHNTRQDTDFWVEASKPERLSEKLSRNLDIWSTRMPRVYDYSDGTMQNFLALGNSLWYQIGIGMGTFNKSIAKAELDYYGLFNLAERDLAAARKFSDYCISRSMNSTQYYRKVLQNTDEVSNDTCE